MGETLLSKLERRLDNVVYRLGFGASRAQARQLVRHGHVRVNDKKLDIPSFQVKAGRRGHARAPRGQERARGRVGRGGEGPGRAEVAGAGRRRP